MTGNSTPHDYTLSSLVAATVNYAVARGVDMEVITSETGLQRQELINPDGRITDDVLPRIWSLLESGNDKISPALHMAGATPPSTLLGSWVGLASYAGNLRSALRAQVQFSSIIANRLSLDLSETASYALLEFDHPLDQIDGGHSSELGAATLHRVINECFDGDVLAGVNFAHAPLGPIEAYERYFRVPVRFGQKNAALVLRRNALDLPMRNVDQALFGYVQNNLELLWERWDVLNPYNFLMRVKRSVQTKAEEGVFDANALAGDMGMSLRSLQRQLQQHGITAAQLLEDECQVRARHLLANTTRSVREIGRSLGYSDDRAFRRAFRRWTGQSPTAYRRNRTSH